MKNYFECKENGQIMVEALIAITIATVGLLGIFTLVSRSLSLNRVVADQYIASNLAAEGIELVKNLIDYNVRNGLPFNNGSCLSEGNHNIGYNDLIGSSCAYDSSRFLLFNSLTRFYGYDAGAATPYKRTVTISWPQSDEIMAQSLVVWTTRGGGEFEVKLEDHFFNWR